MHQQRPNSPQCDIRADRRGDDDDGGGEGEGHYFDGSPVNKLNSDM